MEIEENIVEKIPPPTLQPIIEKTIEYVVRNGVNFESELRKRNGSSTKFAFLLPTNPHYPYYKKELFSKLDPEEADKLRSIRMKEQKQQEEMEVKQKQTTIKTLSLQERIQQEMKLIRIPKEKFIGEKELNKYTVTIPPHMKPDQVDLIKLTAQFVARNGKKFLSNLSSKEAANPEFEFLDPVHPLFPYFQKLVNAYCACIVPAPNIMERLAGDCHHGTNVLKAFGSAEFLRRQKEQREEQEADEEEERLQMQLIDWHRFVILETLDFDPGEVYPAPGRTIPEINEILTTDNRGDIKVTLADDVQSDQEMDMDIDGVSDGGAEEMEMDMDDSDGEDVSAVPVVRSQAGTFDDDDLAAVPQLASPEEVKLREQVERELRRRAGQANRVESPFTGEMVPYNEISEHIRIMLLNPKWKEQKETLMDKMRTTSLADDRDMAKNLNIFSKRRNELTGGVGAPKNQVIPGKSAGWDGFNSSRDTARENALAQDVANQGKRKADEMLEEQESNRKQADTDSQANRMVPAQPPPAKRRKIAKGVIRTLTFQLPNGQMSSQNVDIGIPIMEIKQTLVDAVGVGPEQIQIVGPGETILDDSQCLGDYGIDSGTLFVKVN